MLAELKLRWEAKLDASDVYNAAEGIVEDGKECVSNCNTASLGSHREQLCSVCSPRLALLSQKHSIGLWYRDTEGAKTPDDDSTGGENKSGGKSDEPQAKKRKIFTNDPGKVESPEAGAAYVFCS